MSDLSSMIDSLQSPEPPMQGPSVPGQKSGQGGATIEQFLRQQGVNPDGPVSQLTKFGQAERPQGSGLGEFEKKYLTPAPPVAPAKRTFKINRGSNGLIDSAEVSNG